MDVYFALSLGSGIALMGLERIWPARKLPWVNGWWVRVLILNAIQAIFVFGLGDAWQRHLFSTSLFQTASWGDWPSAVFAYFVVTFIYYWWHRWRHQVYWLWVTLHQIHHSPQRIETITSFYKHPAEILVNSALIAGIAYGILGLTPKAAAILTFLTCIAEYLYHMNLRTPHWLGYIFQRPESHRIHHQLNRHDKNFSDLPVWDILFGTFENPRQEVKCGFRPEREARFFDMLVFKDVNGPLGQKK